MCLSGQDGSAAYVFLPIDSASNGNTKRLKLKQDYAVGGERPADCISLTLIRS